jgi:hypothetical protein
MNYGFKGVFFQPKQIEALTFQQIKMLTKKTDICSK